LKIELNDFDIPINVHKITDALADRIAVEKVFGSAGMREKILLDDKLVVVLHRIEPELKTGTAVVIDPRDGKKRRMKFKQLAGGKFQLDTDRKNGCGRLFNSRAHAINAALAMGINNNREKNK